MKIKTKSILIIIVSLLLTATYAFLRHQVFGKFEPTNMALFITNKALIFSAIVLVPFMIKSGEKIFKVSINSLIMIHIILSLYLLNPGFYPKLFESSNMMNSMGVFLVGFGIMAALFVFNSIAKMFIEIAPVLNSSLLFVSVIAHNVSIGWHWWLNYSEWNGGMPPITLITALTMLYSLILTGTQFFKKTAKAKV